MYYKSIVRIIFYKLANNIYFKNRFNYVDNMVNFVFIYDNNNNIYKILTNMYMYTLSQKTCICIKSNDSFILFIYLS